MLQQRRLDLATREGAALPEFERSQQPSRRWLDVFREVLEQHRLAPKRREVATAAGIHVRVQREELDQLPQALGEHAAGRIDDGEDPGRPVLGLAAPWRSRMPGAPADVLSELWERGQHDVGEAEGPAPPDHISGEGLAEDAARGRAGREVALPGPISTPGDQHLLRQVADTSDLACLQRAQRLPRDAVDVYAPGVVLLVRPRRRMALEVPPPARVPAPPLGVEPLELGEGPADAVQHRPDVIRRTGQAPRPGASGSSGTIVGS